METRTCINVRNVPNGLPDEETEGDTPATHHALVWGFCASVVLAMLLPSLFRNQASLYSTAVFNASVSVDWQGFGTSLAWWAEFVGTLDSDSRRQLLVQIFDQESNDSLKFNIVRYNLGGAPYMLMENGTTPGTSFGAYKGIPSPRLPNGSFVWDVELPQVRVAQDCASLGVNVVEAFVNSPPHWMTKSGTSMGNWDGSDNLDRAKFTEYADYIAKVIHHGINTWDIPFTSIEPFNEPLWRWHPKLDGQEGAFWSTESQRLFLPLLKRSLDTHGLSEIVRLAASDDFSVWDAIKSWKESTSQVPGVSKTSVHGYPMVPLGSMTEEAVYGWNVKLAEYQARVRERIQTIWMSESGGYGVEDDAIMFAFDIIRHLNILKANAWVYWQVLDKVPGWALLTVSPQYPWWFSKYNYNPQRTINYYTMKQFSFHIRPGYSILRNSKSDNLDYCHVCVLSAISKDRTRLVIIVLNIMSNAVHHNVSVSDAFSVKTSTSVIARRTCYRTNDTYSPIDPKTVTIEHGSVSIHLFAFSVTTVELF